MSPRRLLLPSANQEKDVTSSCPSAIGLAGCSPTSSSNSVYPGPWEPTHPTLIARNSIADNIRRARRTPPTITTTTTISSTQLASFSTSNFVHPTLRKG
ncbi:hypothetical protein LZ32DRAFT_130908 [Colletotrichum eremochloae]|nr:hypothetical protein LZ32DRAFT_130908 [Colletotrichum eremochloae]